MKFVGLETVKSPLYIFGYGSLLWKPGYILEDLQSFQCICLGWQRMFAQRSCDHRGTDDFPGLVVTLVEASHLYDLGITSLPGSEATCTGAVWQIPDHLIDDVLIELDYREKGGYQRHLVNVQLLQKTDRHNEGDISQALVYVGTYDNPYFYKPEIPKTVGNKYLYLLTIMSNIICVACGPSGKNSDYLLNLVKYLNDKDYADLHLNELANEVSLKLGPWQSYWKDKKIIDSRIPIKTILSRIRGWGSNEFKQISLTDSIYKRNTANKIFSDDAEAKSIIRPKTSPCYWVASGAKLCSLTLSDGRSVFWGDGAQLLRELIVKSVVSPTSQSLVEGAETAKIILSVSNILGVSLGHDHNLLLHESGWVLSFGCGDHSQCSGSPAFVIPWTTAESSVVITSVDDVDDDDIENTDIPATIQSFILTINSAPPSIRVLKVATGLRHSAAITTDGKLYTWGDCKHKQSLTSCNHWSPPDGSLLVDVACGAKHTVVIDNVGRIWTFGSNKYNALGRTITDESKIDI
jgi:cation transport regulator ChaC